MGGSHGENMPKYMTCGVCLFTWPCSGTLSPIPALAEEFTPLKFPFRLENNHVISAKQLRVLVVRRGVTNKVRKVVAPTVTPPLVL